MNRYLRIFGSFVLLVLFCCMSSIYAAQRALIKQKRAEIRTLENRKGKAKTAAAGKAILVEIERLQGDIEDLEAGQAAADVAQKADIDAKQADIDAKAAEIAALAERERKARDEKKGAADETARVRQQAARDLEAARQKAAAAKEESENKTRLAAQGHDQKMLAAQRHHVEAAQAQQEELKKVRAEHRQLLELSAAQVDRLRRALDEKRGELVDVRTLNAEQKAALQASRDDLKAAQEQYAKQLQAQQAESDRALAAARKDAETQRAALETARADMAKREEAFRTMTAEQKAAVQKDMEGARKAFEEQRAALAKSNADLQEQLGREIADFQQAGALNQAQQTQLAALQEQVRKLAAERKEAEARHAEELATLRKQLDEKAAQLQAQIKVAEQSNNDASSLKALLKAVQEQKNKVEQDLAEQKRVAVEDKSAKASLDDDYKKKMDALEEQYNGKSAAELEAAKAALKEAYEKALKKREAEVKKQLSDEFASRNKDVQAALTAVTGVIGGEIYSYDSVKDKDGVETKPLLLAVAYLEPGSLLKKTGTWLLGLCGGNAYLKELGVEGSAAHDWTYRKRGLVADIDAPNALDISLARKKKAISDHDDGAAKLWDQICETMKANGFIPTPEPSVLNLFSSSSAVMASSRSASSSSSSSSVPSTSASSVHSGSASNAPSASASILSGGILERPSAIGSSSSSASGPASAKVSTERAKVPPHPRPLPPVPPARRGAVTPGTPLPTPPARIRPSTVAASSSSSSAAPLLSSPAYSSSSAVIPPVTPPLPPHPVKPGEEKVSKEEKRKEEEARVAAARAAEKTESIPGVAPMPGASATEGSVPLPLPPAPPAPTAEALKKDAAARRKADDEAREKELAAQKLEGAKRDAEQAKKEEAEQSERAGAAALSVPVAPPKTAKEVGGVSVLSDDVLVDIRRGKKLKKLSTPASGEPVKRKEDVSSIQKTMDLLMGRTTDSQHEQMLAGSRSVERRVKAADKKSWGKDVVMSGNTDDDDADEAEWAEPEEKDEKPTSSSVAVASPAPVTHTAPMQVGTSVIPAKITVEGLDFLKKKAAEREQRRKEEGEYVDTGDEDEEGAPED